jgi:hypothetical protein
MELAARVLDHMSEAAASDIARAEMLVDRALAASLSKTLALCQTPSATSAGFGGRICPITR